MYVVDLNLPIASYCVTHIQYNVVLNYMLSKIVSVSVFPSEFTISIWGGGCSRIHTTLLDLRIHHFIDIWLETIILTVYLLNWLVCCVNININLILNNNQQTIIKQLFFFMKSWSVSKFQEHILYEQLSLPLE